MPRTAAAFLVSIALATGVAAQGAGDGDVRSSRDAATGDTLTTLTLILSNPKGPLPITMVLTKIARAKPATTAASDMRIDVDMRLFVGVPDYRDPQLQMTLDRGTKRQRDEDHSVEPGINMRATNQVSIMFSSAALGRLAAAATIDGRLFGVEFTITPRQLRAIQHFAGR